MRTSEITKPYFSHDYAPLEDKNLLKLFITMGAEGYGIYWLIVEFMHQNTFIVGEENLLAYKTHIDVEKIKMVMNDFQLFRQEQSENGNIYVSDRILRNLNYVEQKNEAKTQAANIRWLLSSFNKSYEDVFGKKPVLSSDEIETLKDYSTKIPDFKKVLPDIIYTLSFIEFDDKIKTKPLCDWLLTKNNLARVYNGEFGKLRHKKTPSEVKAEQQKLSDEQKESEQEKAELESKMNAIETKSEAIEFLSGYITKTEKKILVNPTVKPLQEKFNITLQELRENFNG